MYLGLGVDASHIHAGYPTDDTQVTNKILKRLHLRGFHPLRQDIPVKFQLHIKGLTLGLITPHLPMITHRYSVCPYNRFRSPLLTVSHIAFFSSAY